MLLISTIVPIIGNYCYSLNFDYQSQIRRCYITITASYITITAAIEATILNFQNYLGPFILENNLDCSPDYNLSNIDFTIDIAVRMGFSH